MSWTPVRKLGLAIAMPLLVGSASFAWEMSARTSPIDDTTVYWASVRAAEATTDKFGTKGTADLIIQCESDTTLLVVRFSNMYVSDHAAWGTVTFRVDEEAAFDAQMISSNDHSSLALRGGNAIRVIKQFIDADKLFVRALPVNESVVDLNFRVAGGETALKSVRDACSW